VPSGGLLTADVPARLNAGEFVMPRDAVQWYGQKFFQNLIAKAQAEQQRAGENRKLGRRQWADRRRGLGRT